jgi:hypothetical protein
MFSEVGYSTNLFMSRFQIILGIILFSGLNKLSQKCIPDSFIKKDRVFQYHTYIYSIIHSILISIPCLLYLFDYISKTTTSFFIDLSMGYAIYDLTVVINTYEIFDWKGIFIHHFAMLLLLSGRESYFDEVAVGLLSEIATIFLNISWIMYQSNKTNTIFFNLNSIIVLILYFFTRVLSFPYLTYIVIINYNLNIVFHIMSCTLSVLNIYWFKLLINKALSVKNKEE